MIDTSRFMAFSDEFVKLAQYDPNRKAKIVGGGIGAGLGAAGASKLVPGLTGKARLAALAGGALVGGLGGREVGEGAATVGRGLKMTAQQARYAMQ